MAKTNWQDPNSGEILSTHISGLQEAVGKIEKSIGIETVSETSIPLSEVFISNDDRCRIYQAPDNKRNWVISPAPIIKKNGTIISSDFVIDYGGGAVIFTTPILESDVITTDATYTISFEGKQLSTENYSTEEKDKLGGIEPQANRYTHPSAHPASMIVLADNTDVETKINEIESDFESHKSESETNFDEIFLKLNDLMNYGVKASRPTTNLYPGRPYFQTDLLPNGKRIEWNNSFWQYSDGSPVDTINIVDGNIYTSSAFYALQTFSAGASTAQQTGINMSRDLIMYMDVKLADITSEFFNVIMGTLSTPMKLRIGFGYDWTTGTADGVSISAKDEVNGATYKFGAHDFQSAFTKIIIWYDKKWGYFNIYLNNVLLGSYKPAAGGVNPSTDITRIITTVGGASTLISMNYYYMCMPLVCAIGDSITAGATLHAPNPDYYPGVDTYQGYPKLLSDYLQAHNIKNYFVVNKGVNGETSDQIKARFNTDVVSTGCKYEIEMGGLNDHQTHANVNISTQNMKDIADTALANNIIPIIIGVTPTKIGSPGNSHQWSIDLHEAEKGAYSAYTYASVWKALQDPNNPNVADDSKFTDTVHLNELGNEDLAAAIESRFVIQ
jgi:lysophospholipase L1-like esterase